MKALKLLAAAVTAIALLSACKDSPGTAASSKQAAVEPVSIAAIEAEARGFTVGSTMSVRTVYVFFDPQCPHCAQLWQSAKPLRSQAKFVWIPVGLINKTSEAQGATLLAAKDPVAAMDQHEASILAKGGGISASGDYEPLKATVVKNTALMNRFGFASVPSIVALHAQTGALVTREGAMPTPALASLLGLQVPGGQ
jgi:thiol:disulfide interchange protein DsbG